VVTSSERLGSEEGGAATKATPPLVRARLSADQNPNKPLQMFMALAGRPDG